MRVHKDVVKTREVLGRSWDMQIAEFKSGPDKFKFQATYYHGAEPKMWSDCYATFDSAARELDVMVDKAFGAEEKCYKVETPSWMGVNITKFSYISEAVKFAYEFNGKPLFPINNI